MNRVWQVAVSLRTTAALLVLFSALLLLNVALPQRGVDAAGYARAVRSGAVARVVLVTLGLGDVPSSVPFKATLAGLFLNLAAVLVDRIGATLRRVRFAAPGDAQLQALLREGELLPREGGPTVEPAGAIEALERMGYRAEMVGARAVWGVKHRFALLGFAVFHASFFLMLVGGGQLYLTRDVVTLVGAEGDTIDSRTGGVVRRAPMGGAPTFRLTVDQVDVRMVDGKPADLAVTLALEGEGSQVSRVNHPARWGALSVLAERAGIAPVLWLMDDKGFTLDHVVVPTASPSGTPTRLELLGGDGIEVVVAPVPVAAGFPERDALSTASVAIRVRRRGEAAFEGRVRSGASISLGDRVLRVEELRYWAGLRAVSERGGALLVAGFVVAVLGTVWRMFWYRREIAVGWTEGGLVVGGRCEFFPARFREEQVQIGRALDGARDPGRRRA